MRKPLDPKVLHFLSLLSKPSLPLSPSFPPIPLPSPSFPSPIPLLYPSLIKSLSLSRPDLSLLLFLTFNPIPPNSPPKFPSIPPNSPPKFPYSTPNSPPKFPYSTPNSPPKFPYSTPNSPPKFPSIPPNSPPFPSPPLLTSFLNSLRLLSLPSLIPHSLSLFSPLSPSLPSLSVLLTSLSDSDSHRNLDLIHDLFLKIPNPDSVCVGSIVAALCRAGKVEEARGVIDVMVERGVKPSIRTCNVVVKAYCVDARIEEVLGFVEQMESESGGLPKPDVVIYTVLIEGFCLVRDFGSVEKILRETEGCESKWKPNSVTYNVYISGLCRAGFYGEAFHQTVVMREKNLRPTIETLNILFDCLCRDPSTVFEAAELLEMSKELDWQADSFFYNTLMGRLVEMNKPIRVLKLMTDMLKKGVKHDMCSFTILTRALCRVGKFRLAKFIITRTEIKADVIAYNTLLHELYKVGELREMNLIYMLMIERNVLPNKFTCGIMIDCLCREGRFLKEAMNFVINLCEDKYLFSTDLISRLTKWLVIYGRLGYVRQLFDEMSKRGFELKPVLFDSLIKELCKKGFCQGDEVCKISFLLDDLLKLR